MSDSSSVLELEVVTTPSAPRPTVPIAQIFHEFLLIGATSFGGGVLAYLRDGLVVKRRWLDDEEFVEMLLISETLPGLNATNMAILVGDKLHGVAGSLAAMAGICLPGAVIMFLAGILYRKHGGGPLAAAALKGVAAAAVGLILATAWQLGRKSLSHMYDLFFVALTILGVNRLHQSVPRVLIVVGIVAILWYRMRDKHKGTTSP